MARMAMAVLGLLLVAITVFAGVRQLAFDRALISTEAHARNTLTLASTALEGRLGRFRSLPRLIAGEDQVRALLSDPADPGLRSQVDAYLERIAALLSASDIYLITPDGVTIAASNYRTPVSFVGQNFSFRPYFTEAMNEGRGQFFALGTTSGKRGFYVSSVVHVLGRAAGVVVFKVDLAPIEAAWKDSGSDAIVVTGPEGIVFMSSRPDWLYHSFHPLGVEDREILNISRRYNGHPIDLLPVTAERDTDGGKLIDIRQDGGLRHYVMVTRPMPDAGWSLRILSDTAPARSRAAMVALITLLIAGLAALLGLIVWRERSRLADRLRIQRVERGRLEIRVQARTRDLARANENLQAEVSERRLTEARLRQTQADLIQASKLAALGQMSAALSHEFNQPLAAMAVYAENAETGLDRGRPDLARDNIGRMAQLVARLASLSARLHSFARKPATELRPVALRPSVEAVLEILDRRIAGLGVTVDLDIPATPCRVVGGEIRLQQVLLNLMANALDVIEAGAPPRIAIGVQEIGPRGATGRTSGRIAVTVRDWGPGVSETTAERLFDPFFSTKGPGKGLGLGLSISYNIVRDFGGMLSVANAEGGGACFTLDLQRADEAPPRDNNPMTTPQ